jgi:predicted nucleotidyltransferase
MDIEEVKKEIINILKEELKDTKCKAFLFGSRVTGTATERSDIDVGIECLDTANSDSILVPVPIEIFSKIKSRCEAIRTLYSIDVVDFYYLNDDFKKVAKVKIVNII